VAAGVASVYFGPWVAAAYSAHLTNIQGGSTGDIMKAGAIAGAAAYASGYVANSGWTVNLQVLANVGIGTAVGVASGGELGTSFVASAFTAAASAGSAKTAEGAEIVRALRELDAQARIDVRDLPEGVRAQYNELLDQITVNTSIETDYIPGRLAHEGSHAVWEYQGRPYKFPNERAAFDAGFAIDSALRLPGAYNPSDRWIRENYNRYFE
jgi:hypothetical protein